MTRRERHFVLSGAVVVALVLAAVVSRRGSGEEDDPNRLQVERVQRLRGLAASIDTLRGVARGAQAAERAVASRYLGGGTAQVAAAQLSMVVREIADRSQVEILREGVLPSREVGSATTVSLQIVSRSDLPGLLDFLAGLDASPLLLAVEDLSVSGDPREAPGAASLTITLQVTGYMLGQI
ncbi:MAG TPA: type II secretion system protein GspM [Longimicrobiaceae bacterium]|nr:type II secretion system protein GspM [Longimicrobiaceae bacterium]